MKRDADFVRSKMYKKDDKLYCKEKAIIEYPVWYEEKGLASVQETISFYGVARVAIGDTYSVMRIPTFCVTSPITVNEVEGPDGVMYRRLMYGKDDCLLESTKVIKHAIESYYFFETYFMRAREPWFIEYEDLVAILDNLPKYGGSNVGANFIANELVTSFITRDAKVKQQFFRQNAGKGSYVYVDLMSVYYSRLNTVNKIAGNRLGDSIVSAIVQKNEGETKLERHLRT